MHHESLSKQASDLADWAIDRLANRTDACGGYYVKDGETKQTTRKGMSEAVLRTRLVNHFEGKSTDAIVGLHSTCPKTNTSKWLAFDIDAHDDKADPAENWETTRKVMRLLEEKRLTPHVFDSNGAGGYHVFVFFEEPQPTHKVYALGADVVRGMPIDIETFPKQPSINPDQFGNWIRLPGRHHTRKHFTKVWTGEGWNELTADYLMSIEGDTPRLPEAVPALKVSRGEDDDDYRAPGIEVAKVIDRLKRIPPAVQGHKGQDATYRVCCMAVRDHGLSTDQAYVAIEDWNQRCDPPWSRGELLDLIENARKYGRNPQGVETAEENFGNWFESKSGTEIPIPAVSLADKPYITNAVTLNGEDGKPYHQCEPLDHVANEILTRLGGWPKVVASGLFVEQYDGSDELLPNYRYFRDHNQFFAWLKLNADVHWLTHQSVKAKKNKGNVSLVKDKEIFEHFRQTLPPYAAIGGLPHVPRRHDLYYPEINLPAADGKALGEFANSFNAETELDRRLMVAALMTPMWGGEPGARPAFVFTSEHGRGVGKTTTLEVFAELYGGAISWEGAERSNDFKSRLLSDVALSQRVCIRDNIKGRLDDQVLEGLITCHWIDGKRMYLGHARRPNLMTWYVSANTPALSRDIADRSYIIRVGKKQHTKDWRTWAFNFIRANRARLIADIIDVLQNEQQSEITHYDRWQAWQKGVLAKLDNAQAVVEMNLQRREECDDDTAQANDLEETMADEISGRGHSEYDKVLITSDQLFSILKDHGLVKKSWGKASAMRWVNRVVADAGENCRLVRNGHNGTARSWLWFGSSADGETSPTSLKGGTDGTDRGQIGDR